jgi:hypothetical protein
MEDGIHDLLVPNPRGDLEEADEDAKLEAVLDVHGHHVLRPLDLGQRDLFGSFDLDDGRLAHVRRVFFVSVFLVFCSCGAHQNAQRLGVLFQTNC